MPPNQTPTSKVMETPILECGLMFTNFFEKTSFELMMFTSLLWRHHHIFEK